MSTSFGEAFGGMGGGGESRSSSGSGFISDGYDPNKIQVSKRQRGNPILKHILNVPWTYANVKPDFVLGKTTCALFLSVRYHLLHPKYLYSRIREVGIGNFDLRIVLVLVDSPDCTDSITSLTTLAADNNFTTVLAWSEKEAARYLETYKAFENKSAALIKEKLETEHLPRMVDVLTVTKSVNKRNVGTLASTFGSFKSIANASVEALCLCPGFGSQKAMRLHDVLHAPL